MRETASGPLDTFYDLQETAEAFGDLAAEYEISSPEYNELNEAIVSLDEHNPLLGQQVVIYGSALTMSMARDGTIEPLALSENNGTNYVEGKYAGMAIRPAYDPYTDETRNVIVHMVETGTQYGVDKYYNFDAKTLYGYVCVEDAEVIPVMPLNAHSLRMLKQDDIIEEFDRVLIDGVFDISQLHDVGRLVNRMVFNTSGQIEMNHQRISYLNSLGLLNNVLLISNDLVIVPGSQAGDQKMVYSSLSEQVAVQPSMFVLGEGYTRRAGGRIEGNSRPELYSITECEEDKKILLPIKNVIRFVRRATTQTETLSQ